MGELCRVKEGMCDSDRRARLCKVREWNGVSGDNNYTTRDPRASPNYQNISQLRCPKELLRSTFFTVAGQHHGCAFIALTPGMAG
ncbi:hypothetical protein SERLA73DRAFT_143253 [Serpula lacrymans var. lacrymans S7.3]|uniref:Uncharacterized protein n=1 Tax=Serpula lacrymans var. lacrymans (strain S7.3) TaxID=936435 RepID=F8Q9B5_SERL3|nr:hypothetical protein SERLA73DRAFT_143253 [Serpula lacrymans var. lacrymans S7.3]